MRQIHNSFGDVQELLKYSNFDLPRASSLKLRKILDDVTSNVKLQMELAIMVDAMEPFVQATFNLEGDGPLVLLAYEEIHKLYCAIHYPNTIAISR